MWDRSVILAVAGLLSGCAAAPQSGALTQARAMVDEDARRRGNVWLTCEPAGASVLVDGVPQGTCGELAGLDRGLVVSPDRMHRLEVKQRGFLSYVTYIAPGGARATMTVRLAPAAGVETAP